MNYSEHCAIMLIEFRNAFTKLCLIFPARGKYLDLMPSFARCKIDIHGLLISLSTSFHYATVFLSDSNAYNATFKHLHIYNFKFFHDALYLFYKNSNSIFTKKN